MAATSAYLGPKGSQANTPLPFDGSSTAAASFNAAASSAVTLNNTAVDMLRRGQNEEAIQLLEWAYLSLQARGVIQSNSPLHGNYHASNGFGVTSADGAVTFPNAMGTEHDYRSYPNDTNIVSSYLCDFRSMPLEASVALDMATAAAACFPEYRARERMMVHSVNGSLHDSDNRSTSHTTITGTTVAGGDGFNKVRMSDELDLHRSPSNYFCVYNRPFVFGEQLQADATMSASASPIAAWMLPHIGPVLLYNTGLAYHRLAVHHGSHTKFYRNALQLYQRSLMLLEGNALTGVYSSELDVMLLALKNNMGHVFSHFCDLPNTRQCVEHMGHVFFLSGCRLLLTKEEYVFFYINILLVVTREPVFSAAA